MNPHKVAYAFELVKAMRAGAADVRRTLAGKTALHGPVGMTLDKTVDEYIQTKTLAFIYGVHQTTRREGVPGAIMPYVFEGFGKHGFDAGGMHNPPIRVCVALDMRGAPETEDGRSVLDL